MTPIETIEKNTVPTLFEDITLNGMTLPNRFVRSATWEGLAAPDGSVTEILVDSMRALAEVLLRGPSTLTSGEREMIATFVSARNDCYFCEASHRAAAAHNLAGNYELVDAVRFDYQSAPVSAKPKAHVAIAGKVHRGGKKVSAEDVARVRAEGPPIQKPTIPC